jgi:hypothetical protein
MRYLNTKWSILAFCAIFFPAVSTGQESHRIAEAFGKDRQYHVSCQVEITGYLNIPNKSNDGRPIAITGKSSIKYDERILDVKSERVERTLRWYGQLEFERKVAGDDQQSKLRPEASRLVILRRNQYEVPFCPTAPLTWGEIELVRTDVFVPALQGLFPARAVRVGDTWRADNISMQELTDLERIDKGELTCTLDKVTTLLGRRTAHVSFEGVVQGVGEDGNARHELRGSFYFDLDANFLTYVDVKGTHHLLDKNGSQTGKVEGTFVITRTPAPQTREISDDALRGMKLDPTPDNTQLVFDNPQVGVRFLYPRNWRIAGVNDNQIGIDENKGSGLLITLSPSNATPTGPQFQQESLQYLAKQQARVTGQEKLRLVQEGLEAFAFEADIGKDRVLMQYYTTRQAAHGATIAARLLHADLAQTRQDVERIARSLKLRGK